MENSIKLQELVDEVRRIVSDRPDTVYQNDTCYYHAGNCSDGSQGCLFGQALRNLGFDIKKFDQQDCIPDISGVINELPFEDQHNSLIDWCSIVQERQDNGNPWGFSVKYADDNLVTEKDEDDYE